MINSSSFSSSSVTQISKYSKEYTYSKYSKTLSNLEVKSYSSRVFRNSLSSTFYSYGI